MDSKKKKKKKKKKTGLDSNMVENIIFRSLSLTQGPTDYEGENYRSQQDQRMYCRRSHVFHESV